MNKKIDCKILYLSFHNSLKKVYGVNNLVHRKNILIKLGRQFLVPKSLRVVAIKELEKMKLLKKQGKNQYLILDYDFNIEEQINKFYKNVNLF